MSAKKQVYGFGVDPIESQNHFYVVIPPKGTEYQVDVYERFEWTPEGLTLEEQMRRAGVKSQEEMKIYDDGQIIQKSDILRLQIYFLYDAK